MALSPFNFRLVPSTFSWSVWSPKLRQNLMDSFRDQLRWNTEEVQLFLFFFLPKHTFVAVVCKQNLLRTTLQLLRLKDWWQIPGRDDLHLPIQRLDSQLFHASELPPWDMLLPLVPCKVGFITSPPHQSTDPRFSLTPPVFAKRSVTKVVLCDPMIDD